MKARCLFLVSAILVACGGPVDRSDLDTDEPVVERLANDTLAIHWRAAPANTAIPVYTATAPELEGRGGLYLEDCHVAEVDDTENAPEGVRSYALDPENAKRLWAISEQMVGQTFDL